MKIAGIEILKGQHKVIKLPIAKLTSGTQIEVPVFINRATIDGPVLLILAGLHGDEINSVDVVRRIIEQKINHVQKGTVICIPVLNVFGFINFSREVPDGKDVNRSFPGHLKGSLASQIAHHVTHEVLPICDYIIDLHTGGKSRFNTPQTRTILDNHACKRLAKAFNTPFNLHSNIIKKSLRETAINLGKTIIVYEGGESLRLDSKATNIAISGIKKVLHYLKMQHYTETPVNSITCHKRKWFRAPTAGFFHPLVDLNDAIKQNQIFGSISGPFADYQHNCIATQSGYIISLNNNPMVNRGDAIIQIAY